MKKIIVILVMLLSGIVANGQTTVREIRDNFEQGCFYLIVDSDVENHSSLMFNAVEGSETIVGGKIMSAVFETVVMSESNEAGEKWLKEKVESANGDEDKDLALFMTFEKYGLIMMEHAFTDDGRVRMQFALK